MTKQNTTLAMMVAVTAVIAGGIIILGILPLVDGVRRLQQEVRQAEKEADDLAVRGKTLQQLSKQSEEIEALKAKAGVYLPTTILSSPYIMDVAAMAGLSKTAVTNVTFQAADVRKGGVLQEYSTTLLVEGTFGNLQTFLALLEQNLRFFQIGTLSFTQQTDSLSMQVTGSIYSKPSEDNYKDTSLDISEKIKSLFASKQIFGQKINPNAPSRPDPFTEL